MRKRCKRKVYQPRFNIPLKTDEMVRPLSDLTKQQLDELLVAVHMSLKQLCVGDGAEIDFHNLAAAINASMVLHEWGVGEEYSQIIADAQQALLRMIERHRKLGKWGLDGDGLKAMNTFAELHEAQCANVTRDMAAKAMLEVFKRMRQGRVLNRLEDLKS